MNTFRKTLTWASLTMLLAACGEGAPGAEEAYDDDAPVFFASGDVKADGFALDPAGYEAAGILRVANTADLATLDDTVGLDSRAAKKIVEIRNASGPFADVIALDAVPYVGESAFQKMLAHARAQGWVGRCGDSVVNGPETCDDGTRCDEPCGAPAPEPTPVPEGPTVHGYREGSYDALGILRVANTADLRTLDDTIALDVRAAKGIFYGRQNDGAFETLAALDAAPQVGKVAFDKLLAYARTQRLVPFCGDGAVQPGEEACDGTPGCSAACQRTYTCGDGVVERGETCDDGNVQAGDGCSDLCAWEIKRHAGGLGVANAADVGTHRFVAGSFAARGGTQSWRLVVDRPSKVKIDIMASSRVAPITEAEFAAGIVDGAPGQGDGWALNEIGVPSPYQRTMAFWRWYWEPRCSSSGCSLPDYDSVQKYKMRRTYGQNGTWDLVVDLAPGVYHLSMNTGAGNQNYAPPLSYLVELELEATGPVCGDGQVSEEETCDDGGRVDGDGCSRACALETMSETESNNGRDRANALNVFQRVQGDLGAGDEDWFAVQVGDAGLTVSFEQCRFDGVFDLYDANGALVASDDDGAGEYCPIIDRDRLPAGRYFLRVRHADARTAGGAYTLEFLR